MVPLSWRVGGIEPFGDKRPRVMAVTLGARKGPQCTESGLQACSTLIWLAPRLPGTSCPGARGRPGRLGAARRGGPHEGARLHGQTAQKRSFGVR